MVQYVILFDRLKTLKRPVVNVIVVGADVLFMI